MSPSSIEFAAGLLVRDERGDYRQASPAEVLHAARNVLAKRVRRGTMFSAPKSVREFLTVKLGDREHEVFVVILLDNQHRLIEVCEMFRGTIDGASVYPREIVKDALTHNAGGSNLRAQSPVRCCRAERGGPRADGTPQGGASGRGHPCPRPLRGRRRLQQPKPDHAVGFAASHPPARAERPMIQLPIRSDAEMRDLPA